MVSQPQQAHEPLLDPSARMDRDGQYALKCARSRLADPGLDEEVVRETWLAVVDAVDRYSGRAREVSTLLAILKHKIVDCVGNPVRKRWTAHDFEWESLEEFDAS